MAITQRKGLEIKFDKNKLLPGELAVVTDKAELWFCYSAGNTKKLQTAEDLQAMLDASGAAYSALLQLIADLELNPSELTNILNNILALQSGKMDKSNDDTATAGQVLTSNGDGTYDFKDPTGGDTDTANSTVTFTEYATDEDIVTGDTHATLFGKILKSIKTLRYGKIDKANIVQNALSTNPDTVASGPALKAVQDQVTTAGYNLSVISYTPTAATGTITAAVLKKLGIGLATLNFLITGVTTSTVDWITIINLPVGSRPSATARFVAYAYDNNGASNKILAGQVTTGGAVQVFNYATLTNAQIHANLSYWV